MKASARETDAILRRLDPGIRAVLVYGPNEGLVRERADKIARQIVPDLGDPFRVAPVDPNALKAEPGLIADEAAAMSMTGGRRLVRVDNAGDGVTAAADIFLKNPLGDSLVLVTADDLSARSSLRKLFEGAAGALSLACYEDDQRSTGDLVTEVLNAHGLKAEADAVAFLVTHLGGDRAVARGELEKLALYKGAPPEGGRGFVTREDAMACIGDSAEMTIDEIAIAATGGDLAQLDKILFKAFNTGENPIPILRAVARRVMRLHLASSLMAQHGMQGDEAMKQLQPPVFFKDAGPFKAHLSRWSPRRLAAALELLTAAELDCKTTGLPAEAICARACLRIANAARSTGR